MRKVVDYRTVNDTEVQKYLDNGFELYGSPLLSEWSNEVIQAVVRYEDFPDEDPVAHAVNRPVRLTLFESGAEELSVFLTPGREPINFIRSNHTDKWEQS